MDDPRTPRLRARALAFDGGADAYRASRPGYPAQAVRWAVPAGAHDVLDLAAGTGKLTAALVGLGLRVLAVDPSPAMLAALRADLPDVEAREGTAEDTGLPAACVDAVTIAQAWHWVDPPRAAAEIARVLRPGGTLTAIWNVLDTSTGWVEELTAIMRRGDDLVHDRPAPELGPRFGPVEHRTVEWADPVPVAALRALVASRSNVILLDEPTREARLAEVDELVARHPDLRGRDQVEIPYRTDCWRAALLPSAGTTQEPPFSV